MIVAMTIRDIWNWYLDLSAWWLLVQVLAYVALYTFLLIVSDR